MKKIFSLLLLLIATHASAGISPKDSTKKSFFHHLSFSTVVCEAGPFFPVKEKKIRSLPFGMNSYLYNVQSGGTSYGFFAAGVYYDDRFGVEILYRRSSFEVDGAEFSKYLSSKYPEHYVKTYWGVNEVVEGLAYRLCYKFHFRYFQVEPQLQFGINNLYTYDESFFLKEKGSNNFIEYSIRKVNQKKNIVDYHLIVDILKRLHLKGVDVFNFELGIKTELMMMPTSYNYILTESPYGGTPTVNEVQVKQNHLAYGVEAVIRFYFKR